MTRTIGAGLFTAVGLDDDDAVGAILPGHRPRLTLCAECCADPRVRRMVVIVHEIGTAETVVILDQRFDRQVIRAACVAGHADEDDDR